MTEERWLLVTLALGTALLVSLAACGQLEPRQAPAEYVEGQEGPSQRWERMVREKCARQGSPLKWLDCRNRLAAVRNHEP